MLKHIITVAVLSAAVVSHIIPAELSQANLRVEGIGLSRFN